MMMEIPIQEVSSLGTQSKSNYTNTAQLKELMTAPPMTAEQHATITRKRIRDRRMLEEAKERKIDEDLFPEPLTTEPDTSRHD
ncbi:MAG: hypothetical protein JWQ23_4072 [Herminiimonas sp.]|nr:hypothetical protein [Herminiimonas sp.]